jgi:hypothetical protein
MGRPPQRIPKRGIKRKIFSARFEYGPEGYLVVDLEIQCSYCYRREMINISSKFASKFKPGFSAVLEKAISYGWLIGDTKNVKQKRVSGLGPVIMCFECFTALTTRGEVLNKELKFRGDEVYALYFPEG